LGGDSKFRLSSIAPASCWSSSRCDLSSVMNSENHKYRIVLFFNLKSLDRQRWYGQDFRPQTHI
jgi:hypothetical protein